MMLFYTLQASLARHHEGRPLAIDSLSSTGDDVVVQLNALTCQSPQVLNLLENGCIASSAACPVGSYVPDGGDRCKCPSYTYPNLAGTECVNGYSCGPHTTLGMSPSGVATICVCKQSSGFVLNAEKTKCICTATKPVYDSYASMCIFASGTCQGKNFVVNAAKTACECPTTKFLHIDGTCDENACGVFYHEVQISTGVCGCTGDWPILDADWKRCIKADDNCYYNHDAVNITSKSCVYVYDSSQCKKISLNFQKCLDSCSEPGAMDLVDTNHCVCKAGFFMKDGACVATSALSCATPNFFHVDGRCSTHPCGTFIHKETLIESTNICQCVKGISYIGQCYQYANEGPDCAEGYIVYYPSLQCVSMQQCTDVIGGVVKESNGQKQCGCQSPKILSLSRDRCVESSGCPANSAAGSSSCDCKDGFLLSNGACVAILACADNKTINFQGTGCITDLECAAAGGEIEKLSYQETQYKSCVCGNMLSLAKDQCVSWLPGKCGGNAYVMDTYNQYTCTCADGYHVESGVCTKESASCAPPNFLHVDGACSAIACGSAGITGEKADATAGATCECAALYSLVGSACVSTSSCVGNVKHVNGLCDDAKCGSVAGEKNDSTATTCACAQETSYLAADGKSCIAACPAGHFANKLEAAGPTCVTSCPDGKPHDKDNVCVESCSGMQKADASNQCVVNRSRFMAVVIGVPVAVVVGVVVSVVVSCILCKKKASGKGVKMSQTRRTQNDVVLSSTAQGQLSGDRAEQENPVQDGIWPALQQ